MYLFTTFEELSDMLDVLRDVVIIYDDVIYNPSESR